MKKCLQVVTSNRCSVLELFNDLWITRSFDPSDFHEEQHFLEAEENCIFLCSDAYFNLSSENLLSLFQNNSYVENLFIQHKSFLILNENVQKEEFQVNSMMLLLVSSIMSKDITFQLFTHDIVSVLFHIFETKKIFYQQAISLQNVSILGLQLQVEFELLFLNNKLNWIIEAY